MPVMDLRTYRSRSRTVTAEQYHYFVLPSGVTHHMPSDPFAAALTLNPAAYLDVDGVKHLVRRGDWIVTDGHTKCVMSDAAFRAEFQPV